MTKRSMTRSVFISALLATTASPVAFAQQGGSSATGGLIEELVVTAQKRTESIQEVPISIIALSGDQLARTAITDILAVAGRTPTLQYSQAGGESQIYIRGVGSNLLAVGADPSVAIHLDGVYLGRPNMGLNQFLDVERVEVLRGPQGTLYGRNATGGSINIISKAPSDELNGYLTAGYGEDDKMELKGAVGGPITDTLSYRVAARHVEDDGYVKNLDPTGSKLDDQNLDTGRVALSLTPSDAFRATATMDWSDFNNGNTAIRPIDNLSASRLLGARPTSSILEEYNNLPTFMRYETGGPTLDIEADLSDSVMLKSITAYKTFDMDFYFNTDGTEAAVTRTTETFDTEQFSQELRLVSQNTENFDWIVGGYYLKEDKEGALGLVRENLRNAVTGAALPLGTFIIPAENDTEAYAAFAQAGYRLSEQVKITAGIRYSDEKKTDFNQQINIFVGPTATAAQVSQGLFGGLNLANFTPALTRRDSRSWDAVTPKFGIDWTPSDNVLVYAAATRGFKSGGYNSYQPSNPVFEPEFIWSYTVGAKTDWMDGKLRLNAEAFYYDYSDLQVTTILNALTLVANAAQAEVKGIDVELTAQPVEPFTYGVSASVLDATYDSFSAPYGVCSPLVLTNATCAGRTAGQVRLINAAGNRLNNAPKFKATTFGEYVADMGTSGTLTVFGQLSHTGAIYFNAANDPNARQKSYTLLDGRIAWTPSNANFEIALYGKNLTEEEYFHNIVQFTSTSLPPPAAALPNAGVVVTDPFSIGHALGYPAPGRQWGIEATYRF
ncbi:MAG: TonB-dependent receptor [Rhodospirillaceae bacterium]|nr:TonB-dependent receptor [Rhodospirillaceae bacterium]